MDELFFYGLNRIQEITEDMDKTTVEKIRENLRVMFRGYDLQRQKVQQAKELERHLWKKLEALQKQLKKQLKNIQRPTTNL